MTERNDEELANILRDKSPYTQTLHRKVNKSQIVN